MVVDGFVVLDKLLHHSLHHQTIIIPRLRSQHHLAAPVSSKLMHESTLQSRPEIEGKIEYGSLPQVQNIFLK